MSGRTILRASRHCPFVAVGVLTTSTTMSPTTIRITARPSIPMIFMCASRRANGRFLPLYFQVFQNVWFHPALVYCMAPVLAIVRPTPAAVRFPTVVVALCNMLLVFVLARRLGISPAAAVGGAALLAVTPAHLMHGRLACDYLLPVPFVLAWLIL